jgi:hypothetical protein
MNKIKVKIVNIQVNKQYLDSQYVLLTIDLSTGYNKIITLEWHKVKMNMLDNIIKIFINSMVNNEFLEFNFDYAK